MRGGNVTIEIALLISMVSVGISILTTVYNFRRGNKADNQKDASEMTTVIVKLENINTGIAEIKMDFKSVQSEVKDLRDKVIINEQSLKSAWKRIESLEKKGV